MHNLTNFCLTLDPDHEDLIKKLSFIPVGLGKEKFSNSCISDKQGENISNKNLFYGEYTFHYWIWKNYLNKIKTKWIGFCQYRKFFSKNLLIKKDLTFEEFRDVLVDYVEPSLENYDCILGNKFSVQNYKFSKILKNHLTEFLMSPELFFNKKKRTLKFHFDLFHGKGNLDLAINQLNEIDKIDFKDYMYSNTEFHPHNMFICKTEILKKYYDTIFPWLKRCENVFGFNNLDGYGKKRIYGFLAERFLSYWFSKNYKVAEISIIGKDLSDYKNL